MTEPQRETERKDRQIKTKMGDSDGMLMGVLMLNLNAVKVFTLMR